jgi:hypothetical protein
LKGHAQHTWQERELSAEEVNQEIQGRLPKGPFEFSADLTFSDVKAEAKSGVTARFQRAIKRDCRYATAGHPYIIAFGLSQALRTIYDGSKQLTNGGEA